MGKKLVKNIAIYIFSAVLSILLIWYIVYHLFNGFQTEIETTPAIIATMSNSFSLDAYIVRDETVITSTHEGCVNYMFEDGERVCAGAVVANIYSGVGAEEVADKILSIDKQIDILEKSSVAENATKTDASVLDKKINEILYIMRDKIEDGDVRYALYKKDELLTFLNKRQIVTQNVSGYEEQIMTLMGERDSLSGQLINLEEKITTEKPGYFYSNADGYENVFKTSDIKNMTLESYNKAIYSDPVDYSSSLVVGKIVNRAEWYILSEVTVNDLKKFNEGVSYSVVFPYNADISINMQLDRIIRENGSEQAVLVFKTSNMPSDFNYLRKQSIQIVEESYTGYKVPASAVRVVDGVKGVYILSGNTAKFKEIDVLAENDGYYIVKEQPTYLEDENYYKKLGLYDMIIIAGKNLYDGKIISNTGVES